VQMRDTDAARQIEDFLGEAAERGDA